MLFYTEVRVLILNIGECKVRRPPVLDLIVSGFVSNEVNIIIPRPLTPPPTGYHVQLHHQIDWAF